MPAILRVLTLPFALFLAACATIPDEAEVGQERMRTPPPTRATIEFIGYEQAVALASGYALGTGDLLRVLRAERAGERWSVDVEVRSLTVPKRTEVQLDAATGELLELRSVPLETAGD